MTFATLSRRTPLATRCQSGFEAELMNAGWYATASWRASTPTTSWFAASCHENRLSHRRCGSFRSLGLRSTKSARRRRIAGRHLFRGTRTIPQVLQQARLFYAWRGYGYGLCRAKRFAGAQKELRATWGARRSHSGRSSRPRRNRSSKENGSRQLRRRDRGHARRCTIIMILRLLHILLRRSCALATEAAWGRSSLSTIRRTPRLATGRGGGHRRPRWGPGTRTSESRIRRKRPWTAMSSRCLCTRWRRRRRCRRASLCSADQGRVADSGAARACIVGALPDAGRGVAQVQGAFAWRCARRRISRPRQERDGR